MILAEMKNKLSLELNSEESKSIIEMVKVLEKKLTDLL